MMAQNGVLVYMSGVKKVPATDPDPQKNSPENAEETGHFF